MVKFLVELLETLFLQNCCLHIEKFLKAILTLLGICKFALCKGCVREVAVRGASRSVAFCAEHPRVKPCFGFGLFISLHHFHHPFENWLSPNLPDSTILNSQPVHQKAQPLPNFCQKIQRSPAERKNTNKTTDKTFFVLKRLSMWRGVLMTLVKLFWSTVCAIRT